MAGIPPPNFTSGNVHVSATLSQMSIGYHPTGMIAEQVFPVMKVSHENDLYYVWDKGQAFRVDRTDGYGTLRADRARAKKMQFGAALKSYQAFEFAEEVDVSYRELANADSVLQLQLSKVRRAQDHVLLDQEIRVANLLTTTGNYAAANFTTNSGTSQWNNAAFVSTTNGAHAVIKAQVETGKEAIRKATGGLLPNTIVIPRAVAAIMYNDPGLADLIKYSPGMNLLASDILPENLWGMKVLIPTTVYQTTNEGEAFSGSDVWGKNVVLAYVNPNPGIDALTTGLIFRVRDWQVKQYRDEFTDTTIYRPSLVQTEQAVAFDCSYLIKNAVA